MTAVPPPPTIPPPAAAPPPSPPPPERSKMWLWVPIAIVGIVLIGWLLLAGLPFGRSDEPRRPVPIDETNTIAEGDPGTTQRDTGTIFEVPETAPPMTTTTSAPPPIVTTTTTAPPTATTTVAPPPATATTAPPPVVNRDTPPRPAGDREPPPRAVVDRNTASREMSESETMNVLRGYITANRYYGIESECINLASLGYSNRGYAIEVRDTCSGAPRTLGRWRVDTLTREVFRQREDGRYLRP